MSAQRILMIGEYEEPLALVVDEFAADGCMVDLVAEGKAAETLLGRYDYDLVIVDLSFARGFPGLEILDVIRQCRVRPKVIIVAAQPTPRLTRTLSKNSRAIADIVRLVGMMVET